MDPLVVAAILENPQVVSGPVRGAVNKTRLPFQVDDALVVVICQAGGGRGDKQFRTCLLLRLKQTKARVKDKDEGQVLAIWK